MKQKKSRKKPEAGGNIPETTSPAADAGSTPSVRILRASVPVWMGLAALATVLAGCPRFDGLYAAHLGIAAAVLAGELAFLDSMFRKGRTSLFPAWKKFTGYSLPAHYFACALPRIGWRNADLIGEGREAFLFSLSLLALAAGCWVFFLAGRPSTRAAFGVITAEEAADRALRRRGVRQRKSRGVLAWILEWIDAIAWAAIAVLLVNIFVFQLYEVPTESMVPAFLGGDRPFALKLATGPRIPLTEWRLPFLRLPRRGDVVTLANPRYPENHRVDIRKYLSQIVYMVTFTGVHLDSTLPDGTPKSDPLVKRIVGLPGEKLMMVDDVLYARRSGDAEYRKVDEPWAAVDLWRLPEGLRGRIQHIPVDKGIRALLAKWDARKAAPLSELSVRVVAAHARVEASLDRLAARGPGALPDHELTRADSSLRSRRDKAVRAAASGENPYVVQEAAAEDMDLSLALAAVASRDARRALRDYAREAVQAAALPPADAYERGSRALNLLVKANLLERMGRDLEMLARGAKPEDILRDADREALLQESKELRIYLFGFYDSRNFPEFPAGEGFLARDEYFALGDNRYNSLDFRFGESFSPRLLDPGDSASVAYPSLLAPFPLKLKFIEGHALFRLWPPSRIGAVP